MGARVHARMGVRVHGRGRCAGPAAVWRLAWTGHAARAGRRRRCAAGSGAAGQGDLTTFSASFRIDTTRKTGAGDLKIGFEVKYQKASGEGGNGSLMLIEGVASWAGWSAGYTDSLMNFWSGDFQFSATAPASPGFDQ